MRENDYASRYWNKMTKNILVQGERGCFPCEGEILGAFNELKFAKPEHCYKVSAIGDEQTNLIRQGNKIKELKIRKNLGPGNFIELVIDFQATLRLTIQGILPFSWSCPYINLQETLKNMDAFVDNFPKTLDNYDREKMERVKKSKLKEISNTSIKVAVSQVLSATPYEWNLVDKGDFFSLCIEMGQKKMITMTLNRKNFAKRISSLVTTLNQVENLFKSLPFPMDISMTKDFVKL